MKRLSQCITLVFSSTNRRRRIQLRSFWCLSSISRCSQRGICSYNKAGLLSEHHQHDDDQHIGLVSYDFQKIRSDAPSSSPKPSDFLFLHEAVAADSSKSGSSYANSCRDSAGELSKEDAAVLISQIVIRTNSDDANNDFDDQTRAFLRQFRGKLNQSLVIQVLKLLKIPNLCSRFFLWSSQQIGYRHTEPVYDVLLELLGFNNKNTKVPHHFLHEIGANDKDLLRRLLNVLVRKCCLNGHWHEAISELGRLKDFGYRPSSETYASLIRVLLEVGKIDSAVLVYREMHEDGHAMDNFTMTRFAYSLCKISRWGEALAIMENQDFKPTTVVYTNMIAGLLEASLFDEAMNFLDRMRSNLCHPNSVTYRTLLSGFLKKKQLGWCKRIVNMMIKEGCCPNPQLFNSLVHAYCVAKDYTYAYKLFKKMAGSEFKPGYVAYNILIGGICGKKELPSSDVFQFADNAFDEMLDLGFVLNKVNVENYTRCLSDAGKFDKAYTVIKKLMSKGFVPDTCTYTNVLEILCKANQIEKSLLLFHEMKENGLVPDVYTYTILIDCFCKVGLLQQAQRWFDEMIRDGCNPNVVTYTTLMHAYLKVRQLSIVDNLFKKMLEAGLSPNVVTYTALIDGFCKVGEVEKAREIYHRMQGRSENPGTGSIYFKDGTDSIRSEPNVFTYGALIDGLCKVHKVSEATNLLDVMSSTGCAPNSTVYDALVDGLCKIGKLDEAQSILLRMADNGCTPNVYTFTSLVNRLFMDKRLDLALKVLSRMLEKSCEPNVVTYTVMVDGLCKVDKTNEAYKLLLMMEEKGCKPNVVTYTAMIDGFGKVGKVEECRALFREMNEKGCAPNSITYRVLIKHCCAAGFLDEAHLLLEEMKKMYWPWTETSANYINVIGGFSREFLISWGLLEETMKEGLNPVVPSYCFLINGLLKYGKLEAAIELYKELLIMSTTHSNLHDITAFSLLIESLCLASDVDKAFELYTEFITKGGIPELTVMFHLIKGLVNLGKFDEAMQFSYCIYEMVSNLVLHFSMSDIVMKFNLYYFPVIFPCRLFVFLIFFIDERCMLETRSSEPTKIEGR